MKKKKIAIVNQRYGLEVNGGSEYYTRMIAEHLSPYYEIEILTTCALDYLTWENFYPVGNMFIKGISVRRFPVKRKRNLTKFRILSRIVRGLPYRPSFLEEIWLKEQGPYCPDLLHYIKEKEQEYDIFIFVTYLYYPTLKGIELVPEKSVLIPTAHNEPYIFFHLYKKLFQIAKSIVYLTEEEKTFVNSVFQNEKAMQQVIGIGVEIPKELNIEIFREKYQIKEEYIIYVGRVDIGKNCDKLFEYFIEYKKHVLNNLKLVILGKQDMEIPVHSDIIALGFVEEEDKYNAIAGAKVLVLPSEYESLSIAILEAMALGKPILVNGCCDVLKAHCKRSGAGYYYKDKKEFFEYLDKLCCEEENYQIMCEYAKKYIQENYQWEKVIYAYKEILK